MAEIFRPPFFQVESAAGIPLAGAKLYFYATGTTTPITVYQDVTLVTPHASPVVADANGTFPSIYLGSNTYKIALYTSADVLVKTVDNINSTSSGSAVLDGTFRVQNTTDPTKQIAFSAAGITTGTTRTATMPDKNGTLAMTSDITSAVTFATAAQALAGTSTTLVVNPAGLYYPTGHLFGLTLSTNAGDATNDIDIAAGDARDSTDTANMVLATALGKQLDVAWAVGGTTGSTLGMLATGVAVANSRYFLWLIKRPDTNVVDFAADTSSTGANIATNTNANYTLKRLVGEVTRAGGVNGTPIWYGPQKASNGYAGINLGLPTASTSGTSIDFTGIPNWAKRITINFSGVSSTGTSNWLVQIGDAGGIETTSYRSASAFITASTDPVASTAGIIVYTGGAAYVLSGWLQFNLTDQTTNTWVCSGSLARSDAAVMQVSAGDKSLSPGPLDRVRITTVGGTDTFDLGKINISWE